MNTSPNTLPKEPNQAAADAADAAWSDPAKLQAAGIDEFTAHRVAKNTAETSGKSMAEVRAPGTISSFDEIVTPDERAGFENTESDEHAKADEPLFAGTTFLKKDMPYPKGATQEQVKADIQKRLAEAVIPTEAEVVPVGSVSEPTQPQQSPGKHGYVNDLQEIV